MYTPQVITWVRVYAVLMALLYLGCVAAGPFMMVLPSTAEMEQAEAMTVGIICIVMGLPLLVLYVVTAFMPQQPWAWVLGIVAIGIGMTSACCLPAAIPLLIYWLKPEVKQWFGRS